MIIEKVIAWYDGEDCHWSSSFLDKLPAHFNCAFSQDATLSLIFSAHGSQVIQPYVDCQIVLSCLHIGHACLTHSYRMNREDVPRCVACDCNLTLIECGEVRQIIMMPTVYKLFQETSVTYVLDFFHEIGLFYRICFLIMIRC